MVAIAQRQKYEKVAGLRLCLDAIALSIAGNSFAIPSIKIVYLIF